ncbi:hypothetical protein D1007_34039 [Hordeum vulgare]|nr:hypothetical protein D1007_34039 [Hordeum vulgare]
MATSYACRLCGVRDAWRHAPLDCPTTRSTSALSSDVIIDQLNSHQHDCAKTWIFAMLATLSTDEFVKFSISLWDIWGARRKAIYEDVHHTPYDVYSFINSYLLELQAISYSNRLGAMRWFGLLAG